MNLKIIRGDARLAAWNIVALQHSTRAKYFEDAFVNDTIRIMHVTMRFFLLLVFFANFKSAYRYTGKEKG